MLKQVFKLSDWQKSESLIVLSYMFVAGGVHIETIPMECN